MIQLDEISDMELGRYFNAKDEPIVLSRSKKHGRVTLTRRSKSRVASNHEFDNLLL